MKFSLDSSGVRKGIDRAKKSISNFSSSAVGSLARVAGAFAGLGLIKSIVNLGTAAAETASKFDAVFKGSAGRMNEEVQKLRETIPSTTAEMQNSLATFAQMAKAFGLNTEASEKFSVEMVKIAGDIASFNNLPIEDAFGKIQSAISGEFEPLKSLGIVINETRLKQEGLNLSIWDGTGQMSAAQKALAVQSILIRDMGDANGDAALTANSAANQIKFLQSSLKEAGTEIGQTILPAVVKLTSAFSTLVNATQGAMEGVGKAIGEMTYGATDETIDKQRQLKKEFDANAQAVRELTAEGKLYKQGLFEGTLWTEGLSEKLEENKRLIDERKKSILQSLDAEKKAAAESQASKEKEIKTTKDVTGEIEKQIEAETDPARKKSLEDRLAAYKELLKAAGDLQSMQSAKPISTSTTASTGGGSSAISGDANASGYVTPREQRAQERAQRAADTERRRRERDERVAEVGAGERARSAAGYARMSAREAAAGFGPGAAKKPSGMGADDKKESETSKETKTELKEQTKLLTTIKEEIQKNP